MSWILGILGVALMVGAVAWAVKTLWDYREAKTDTNYQGRLVNENVPKPKVAGKVIPLGIMGLLLLVMAAGIVRVPALNVAVIENTLTGRLIARDPGLYIFPFDSHIPPFFHKTTQYSLRRQIIEIGGEDLRADGVQADSNSPGRPVVYYWSRGYCYPNRENIIDLHRAHGDRYTDDWVEAVWVAVLKGAQGKQPYDYVGNNRETMANDVERVLQTQLVGDEGQILVRVTQLAIKGYEFTEAVDEYLNTVMSKEFERQKAEQQIEVNTMAQDAAKIESDTMYIQALRASEAQADSAVKSAKGSAEAVRVAASAEAERIIAVADAHAHQIRVEYEAEAKGIQQVNSAIGVNYLEYNRQEAWASGGRVPTTLIVGEGNAPAIVKLLE